MKKVFSIMSNLQTHHHFKLDFQKKWTNLQEASGWSTASETVRKISLKAWSPSVKYPNREYKHDIKESEGNIFSLLLKGDVQGDAHLQNQNYFVSKSLNV